MKLEKVQYFWKGEPGPLAPLNLSLYFQEVSDSLALMLISKPLYITSIEGVDEEVVLSCFKTTAKLRYLP